MSFFEKLKSSIGTEEMEEEKPAPAKAQKIRVKDAEKKPLKHIKIPSKKEEHTESSWFEPEGELAVDVYQTNGEIVIQSAIAGVNADNLDIAIENDIVTISGERRNPNEEDDKSYFYQECYWGPFSRQIILPEEIDTSRIEASMKDGVFTLRLPKLERQKVKRIKVRG